jgi:hypothetical protein
MSAGLTGFAPSQKRMRGENAQINLEQAFCLILVRM